MCGAFGAYEEVIENPSKIMTDVTRGASASVSAARLFLERKDISARDFIEGNFGATWSIWGTMLARTGI